MQNRTEFFGTVTEGLLAGAFVEVEIIGATGGASRLPYRIWVVYGAFVAMAGVEMLVAAIPQ